MGVAPGSDREVRPRRFRKDALERDGGRESAVLPNGKETSRARGPAVLGGSGNGVDWSWLFTSRERWRQPCPMRIGEAGASRSGFGSERSSRGGEKPKGGADRGRAATFGCGSGLIDGARPRGRAHRGRRAETRGWQRPREQESPYAPSPRRRRHASGAWDLGFRWGLDGRCICRKAGAPSLFGGRSTRLVSWLGVSRKRWPRAVVAVEVRATGLEHPHSRCGSVAGLQL